MTTDQDQDQEPEKKHPSVGWLKYLSSFAELDERERLSRLGGHWYELSICHAGVSLEAALQHAYGRPDGPQLFWENKLSRPIRIEPFVRLLAVSALFWSEYDNRLHDLRDALQEALRKRGRWFIPRPPPDAISLDAQMEIEPREAVEWLMLRYDDLIPDSLRIFMENSTPTVPGGGSIDADF